MKNKKNIKLFALGVLLVVISTLLLAIFYNTAFIPACIFMFSLFLFTMYYMNKDNNGNGKYILFIIGVILVVFALIYTIKRLI